MKKKDKSIAQIREDFQKSMQKMVNKHGTSVTFSVRQGGEEKVIGKFEPKKK